MDASSEQFPRHWSRHKIELRIRLIQTDIGGDEKSYFARGNDVSEGGMSVFAPTEIELGKRLKVEFILPISRKPMLVEAVVRNRSGYRYGLQFVTLSPAQRHEIIRLCDAAALTNLA